VNIEVDLEGYHESRSRDAQTNDNLVCLAMRARSTAFAPDMQEVFKAKWVLPNTTLPTFVSRFLLYNSIIRCPSLNWQRWQSCTHTQPPLLMSSQVQRWSTGRRGAVNVLCAAFAHA
jgi:hypothetical protein